MIKYNKLVEILESLTIEDLNEVKNNIINFLEKKNPLTQIESYEFIEDSDKEYIDEYTDYYIKLGLLTFGVSRLEEIIDEVIYDKTEKQNTKKMKFNELEHDIIHWGRAKLIDDPKIQLLKVIEHFGEIQRATSSKELEDAIGNTLASLILLNDMLEQEVDNQLHKKIMESNFIDISQDDLYEYMNEDEALISTEEVIAMINTDMILEFSKLAELLNKITNDNEKQYVKNIHAHILETFRWVLYLAEINDIDFIKALDIARCYL